MWRVEERGEFWRREERKEGGAEGGGGKRLVGEKIWACEPEQAIW